ncbi:MAG: MerR family DNA-binding protein [Burkholderiaceae bacterium]|nr:MerR family DNA-binding protein [Burkholderiaceae bacterium]
MAQRQDSQHTMAIGDAARAAAVTARAIRYYERVGLMPRPDRTQANYRQYDGEAIHRLRFIRLAQSVGFTLDDIAQLIALDTGDSTPCETVRQLASQRLRDVQERLKALQQLSTALSHLIAQCGRSNRRAGCGLLQALLVPGVEADANAGGCAKIARSRLKGRSR